ncbi:MAG: tRNA (guanosine(37)-N1)-methyltransferase TrmD [Sedimentisphaerales bacterium]|nr:tRNA (guanosine(37)-N1)-methyltransferase TrmD [Sedimentisphaerales bacterium]
MWIDLLTLFPEMFSGVFGDSILKRAQDNGVLRIEATNIRDFAQDKHRSVDDKPYGGGVGMVMMCQPVFDAVESLQQQKPQVDEIILLTPQGQKFDQQLAKQLAQKQRLILIAGHYEGFDERIRSNLATMEISIGDYVLTGGEIPAMIVVDTIARLVPGVLGSAESHLEESFSENLLEYPQYTRPAEFRGMQVPEVLTSGNHERIRKWRLDQARQRTRQRRPDLLNETD